MIERRQWPEGIYQKIGEQTGSIIYEVEPQIDPPGHTLKIIDTDTLEIKSISFHPAVNQLTLGLLKDNYCPDPYSDRTQVLIFDSENQPFSQN